MRTYITLVFLLAYSFSADAGNWQWTTETCDRQNTAFMKCRCRPNASGPTCSETEAVEGACVVSASSAGFEDEGCTDETREDCAILTVADEAYRLLSRDPTTRVKRGIVVTTFDPESCSKGGMAETFDTYESESRANAFISYMNGVEEGTVVILMTADEYTRELDDDLLVEIGSPEQEHHAHRSSLSIITKKTSDGWCTLASDYKDPGHGPAVAIIGAQGMLESRCINDQHRNYKKHSELFKKYMKFLQF